MKSPSTWSDRSSAAYIVVNPHQGAGHEGLLLLTETFFIRRYPSATPTLVGSEGMQQQFMFWSIAKVQNMKRCTTPSREK